MPFDGVLHHNTLDRTLAALGIKPVPKAILEEHKAYEIAKHPASFFYGRMPLYNKCLLGSLISTIGGPVTLLLSPEPYWVALTYFVASLAVMLRLALFTRLREPARWIESRVSLQDETDIPLPIQRLAAQVLQLDPNVKIIVGTLFQQDVVLDPYLRVEKYEHGSRVSACLGVWDGEVIIHLAGQNFRGGDRVASPHVVQENPMRRLLLIVALALSPVLAHADDHVAGQWQADLGHGVLINMDVLADGHWTSETIHDNKVVAVYAGTYELTRTDDTHGRIVLTPYKSHVISGKHHEAKVEHDNYVISDDGKVATFTSGKDKLVFHNTTAQ